MSEINNIDRIKEDIQKLCQLRKEELDPVKIHQMEKKISQKLKIWWDCQSQKNQMNAAV